MEATSFDLAQLLEPVAADAFLRDTWEKEPLVLRRGEPGYYAELFSLADVDRVIAFTRPRFTEPGAFRGGPPAARTYVQGWLPDRQLVPSEVYPGIGDLRQVFAQGRSVIIRSMQHRWPAIAALCRNLEAVFHCPVHANLYLTPPAAQGFEPHLDTHEVFALQLDGAKLWRLYGPAATLPLAEDKMSLPRARLGSPREVRLEAGDLLYIPRGHAHEAFTTDSSSLHLTVGVNVYRWADLLHQALAEVTRRDARFRETLPPGTILGQPLPAGVMQRFQELLRALEQAARPEDAARRLGDQFFDELAMLPAATFVPPEGVERMSLDTLLARRPGAICRVLVDGEGAVIEFPGGRLGGPARIAAALHFVAGTERFPVRDLPDGLGDDAKLVLARRLVREGLLSVVREPGPAARPACANGTGARPQQPAAP
jgi:ribosomal protein L16 Arg81 hydroxylase